MASNEASIRSLLENVWLSEQRLWENRTRDVYWSTGAYVVNVDRLRDLFTPTTEVERADINQRFHQEKAFYSKCDQKDRSMAGKLR
jgi:hypothetical protein